MSNSLEPDQARHLVGPDLGPNCLQKPPEDDICYKKSVKGILQAEVIYLVVCTLCTLRPNFVT